MRHALQCNYHGFHLAYHGDTRCKAAQASAAADRASAFELHIPELSQVPRYENNEEALYKSIKQFLDNPALLAYYRKQAMIRGKEFSKAKTVQAVEHFLERLV